MPYLPAEDAPADRLKMRRVNQSLRELGALRSLAYPNRPSLLLRSGLGGSSCSCGNFFLAILFSQVVLVSFHCIRVITKR